MTTRVLEKLTLKRNVQPKLTLYPPGSRNNFIQIRLRRLTTMQCRVLTSVLETNLPTGVQKGPFVGSSTGDKHRGAVLW